MIFFKLRELISSSLIKRDRIVIVNLIFAISVNFIIWLLLLFNFWQEDFVALRYNIYFGISAFGPWYYVLLMPFFGLLVIAINFFWSVYLYLNYRFLVYFLIFNISLVNLALLVPTLLFIYFNL